jgi:hypothetical protein
MASPSKPLKEHEQVVIQLLVIPPILFLVNESILLHGYKHSLE